MTLRALAAVLTCLCAIALTGCFGSDDDDNREEAYKAPIGTSGDFERKSSLLGDLPSAGAEGENYVPEGEIVADSGFRPEVDGFALENYGNDVGPINMQPQNMEELFGEQVCVSGSGKDCALAPAALEWMENQNE